MEIFDVIATHTKFKFMKNLIIGFLASVLFFAISCEPNIYFNEPQPSKAKNSSSFPKKYIGFYRNSEDSSSLIINENSIVTFHQNDFVVMPAKRDSIDAVINDLNIKGLNKFTLLKTVGDTGFYRELESDTFFKISDVNILREFKGRLMLNIDHGESGWQVFDVYLNNKKNLNFSELLHNNIENVKEITKVEETKDSDGKTSRYSISPNKKELKKLLKKGQFTVMNTYVKMD